MCYIVLNFCLFFSHINRVSCSWLLRSRHSSQLRFHVSFVPKKVGWARWCATGRLQPCQVNTQSRATVDTVSLPCKVKPHTGTPRCMEASLLFLLSLTTSLPPSPCQLNLKCIAYSPDRSENISSLHETGTLFHIWTNFQAGECLGKWCHRLRAGYRLPTQWLVCV